MFLESVISFAPFWACFVAIESTISNTGEIVEFHEPSYCAIDEYFNVIQLKCITCDSDKNLVPSQDGCLSLHLICGGLGLSCVCNERSKIKRWNFTSFPVCELCKENEIPTSDQLDCILCPMEGKDNSTTCENFQCPLNAVRVERTPNGSLNKIIKCLNCDLGLKPSTSQTECVPCRQTIFTGQRSECSCHEGQLNVNELCVENVLKNWPDEKRTFTITYENGVKVDSLFLREHLLGGIFFCKMGNQTACQSVANMCCLLMYNDAQKSSPCSIFSDRKRIPTSHNEPLPWIYYGEGEAPALLSRKRISARFNLDPESPMSYLNLTGVIYNPDGSFKGIRKISGHMLQLCPASWRSLDSSFRFAAKYYHSCQIPARQLLQDRDTEFIDLYLRYKKSNSELLYALPVLVLNMNNEGSFKNRERDRMQWQFVRRFFLIDKITGFDQEENQHWNEGKFPKAIRYAKSITLNVKMQGGEEEGKVLVPYLAVEYGELTREEIERNDLIFTSFRVDYQMENTLSHVLEVCMGVFSGLAIVWSSIRTWSHSKRSGRLAIDLKTVAQLVLFTCGNLANVFFLVVFCISLNFFVFFKGQSVFHVLLPTKDQEDVVRLYIIFAFLLKIIEIGQLIYNQITIDIFFIDWERPRARNMIPRTRGTGVRSSEADEEQPVSIWRTYFVANEWNEIQTKRKLNVNIHILATILILKVFGVEYWATSDPELHSNKPDEFVGNEFSFTCQFSVGCLVYLCTYTVQGYEDGSHLIWTQQLFNLETGGNYFRRIFMTLIYERYIKNGIQEFVDVCSMANISVFILSLENYGFYIHGRSAHGFADTDMQTIINQLQREEEDLVGHRGLLPATDQQTFEMTVPTQLRAYYRKVMSPLKNMSQTVKRLTMSTVLENSKQGSENIDKSVQAYHNMNRFLAAFLEHALKDLDYEVREKLFAESLLEIEFSDASEKGVFYSDNGHSFDNVLFYGNEFSLLTFDILLFSFVIVLMEDFLVAGMVTLALAHVLAMIRNLGGRKNLAKKTLIDERFLI